MISYGIATTKYKGKPLIYFAGYKNHTSIHPATSPVLEKIPEFQKYKKGSGTLQFPITEELPMDLIRKFILIRKEAGILHLKQFCDKSPSPRRTKASRNVAR